MTSASYLEQLVSRYPCLKEQQDTIEEAFQVLKDCFQRGSKLLICGNGGSASDSDHIVGELMKDFCKERTIPQEMSDNLMKADPIIGEQLARSTEGALPAINLTQHIALGTAFGNDTNAVMQYSQQVYGYGRKDDVLLCISTSGNSKNVVYAAVMAKAIGMKVIALDGRKEGKIDHFADVAIKVPQEETYKIQELHLPVYHCLCLMLEEAFWPTARMR